MKISVERQVTRDARVHLDLLMADEPAILVEGPRGSGKSTLIREVSEARGARLVDLDDVATLSLVREDPVTALRSTAPVVVDEFQRAPEVLSVVKQAVDRGCPPGRFLLAGSVSSRLLPTGTETLTGRVHRLHLAPLSAGEVLDGPGRLLPELLAGGDPRPVTSSLGRRDVLDLVAAGGYPAALRRSTAASRSRWYASYLSSVAGRDLPEVVDVRHPGALERLYRLVAQRTSGTLTRTALAEALTMSRATTSSYLDLLRHVYLVTELPGWTVGVSAKESARPKLHVTDTGLAAAATGTDARRLATGGAAGALLESFVVAELAKQAATTDEPVQLAHFRDRSGVEVDVLAEQADGTVTAFEVKSATRVSAADASGLRYLRDRLGPRFGTGIVLHTGPLTARLDDRIWAMPVPALWGGDPTPDPGPP